MKKHSQSADMPEFLDNVLGSPSSRICVIAGPGTGKTTRILLPKAKGILGNSGVDPSDVLLLTFSRLSAIDLKAKVGKFDRAPRASTVHSYALAFLLSENDHEIRRRVEAILFPFETASLLGDLKLVFPQINKRQLRKRLEEFSAGWATRPDDAPIEEDPEKLAFKAAVVAWLNEHDAAMMEEIVHHAVKLAARLPESKLIRDPQFILVDEYQDLNRLEQAFIAALAQSSKLLLVVGDPDQSIYSFKYAYPDGIQNYSQAEGVDPHTHLVTGRCPKQVVKLANQLLIQGTPGRQALLEALPTAREGEIHLVRKGTQEEEFAYVLKSVSERLANRRTCWHLRN